MKKPLLLIMILINFWFAYKIVVFLAAGSTMYLNLKHLIWDIINRAYVFLDKSDDWIESTPADTLQMWLGIGVVIGLIVIVLGCWAVSKIENSPAEREKIEEARNAKRNNRKDTK